MIANRAYLIALLFLTLLYGPTYGRGTLNPTKGISRLSDTCSVEAYPKGDFQAPKLPSPSSVTEKKLLLT